MADRDDLTSLADLAARVAPTLVGQAPAQAEAHLAEIDPRLSLRVADAGAAVTMEYRFGRITATAADGVIVQASPG